MELIKISKLDIALVHLETAIDLFLNNQNYICAATLAGASEEILGKYLLHSGKINAFNELCTSLKEEYDLSISAKEIGNNFVNYPRNELKHFDKPEHETLEIDDQAVAVGLIVRSLSNLVEHDKTLTHNAEKFLRWVYKNRPDLLP
jgi:hypothetical protein